jgi:hypothetical protein
MHNALDGEIDVATLVINGIRQTRSPVTLPLLALIAVKDPVWYGVSNAISPSSSLATSIVSSVQEVPFLPVQFES